MSRRPLDILLCGDLILDAPEPDHWLAGLTAATCAADLTIGHLEVPHTTRGRESGDDVPAPAADPAHLAALRRACFAAVTLAGNHLADCGPQGIADTMQVLKSLGIAHCGAGPSLEQAREPAWLTAAGRRVALLSYNCVGPESSWANEQRAGCAYVRIESADGAPIAPAAALSRIDPASLALAAADIRRARGSADLVIVAFHKGIVHRPAVLAPYERPLCQAAIDAGADVVVGHHAHIVRGIELYRGRPIYHGLGNGCVVTRALRPDQANPRRAEWARRRRELFGFEPDPAFELAPFHPEAVHAMMARVKVHDDSRLECGFVPVHVEAPGRPLLAPPERAAAIRDYIGRITVQAGLPALVLQPADDMVRVSV